MMPEKLRKRMEELSVKGYGYRDVINRQFQEGFRACFDEMKPLIEALEFYAAHKNKRLDGFRWRARKALENLE